MTALRQREVDRWTLAEAGWANVFHELRASEITLSWTELEKLSGSILNVFAPHGSVLWGVTVYRAASDGHARTVQRLLDRPSARDLVVEGIAETGAPRRSVFSYVLLGGLTRFLGDAFLPEELPKDYFLLARRHISLFVPSHRVESVRHYFEGMLDAFGSEATWPAGDSRCFVVDSEARSRAPEVYRALGTPALLLNARECAESIELLRQLVAIEDAEALRARLATSTALAGDVSVALPSKETGSELTVPGLCELLDLRVRCALRTGPTDLLEKLFTELRGPTWRRPELVDARDRLKGVLLHALADVPVVLSDPFEDECVV